MDKIISTEEIKQDIADTEREIREFKRRKENQINYLNNEIKIREEFIEKLEKLLEERGE